MVSVGLMPLLKSGAGGWVAVGMVGLPLTTCLFLSHTSPLQASSVTARKDDAPAAVQAAIVNVVGLNSSSAGGGLIQTTSG